VPAATVRVDLSCIHISSHKNLFLRWGHSQGRIWYPWICVKCDQNGGEQTRTTGRIRGDRGGVWRCSWWYSSCTRTSNSSHCM